MSANIWKTSTANAFNTTLNGNIAAGDTTITLTTTTNLQAPGVLVIDRQDVNGNDTPNLREYVSFTGISSNQITGVTRALGGSTGQAHNSAAKVEECFSVTHWNDLISAILNVLTTAGALDTTKVVDLSTSQTLSTKILASPTITGTVGGKTKFTATQPTLVSDSDGTTITFDMNSGNYHQVTLGGNRTLAVSNVGTPQAFVVQLKQDGTGSRTVTWWSGILWNQGSTPTLTTTAAKTDIFGFIYDGTTYWGSVIQQNS